MNPRLNRLSNKIPSPATCPARGLTLGQRLASRYRLWLTSAAAAIIDSGSKPLSSNPSYQRDRRAATGAYGLLISPTRPEDESACASPIEQRSLLAFIMQLPSQSTK